MSGDRDHLLRGQGLLTQTLVGFATRWKVYITLCAALAGLGGIILPLKTAPDGQVACAAWHQSGKLVHWIASGKADPMMNVSLNGESGRVPVSVLALDPQWQTCWQEVKAKAITGAVGFGALGLCLCLWLTLWMRASGLEATRDRIIGGTELVSEGVLAQLTAQAIAEASGRQAHKPALHIASVPIPAVLECRHFAVLGTTGSGKTTVLRQMLDGIEKRGEAALVYDTSGEFVAHYYRPERGDIILNPFDARSSYWSPFSEMAHPADADRIARQLVSETGERDDDVWLETSRILVANILRTLSAEGRTTLPDLIEALQSKTKAEMKLWLAATSSARTFEDDADRASGSVLFMLAKASNLLQFLLAEPGANGSFSFREFIAGLDARTGPRPWIFVPRKEDYFEAMKPLLACWLECAASSTLGLVPSNARRLWFFLDELADLPRVENLTRLLPEGRKFGAGVVLTFQAIGQMHKRYGRDSAEALIGCCNSKLYLQLVDQDTRVWASRNIGDVEVEVRTGSDSFGYGSTNGQSALGSTRVVRPAVIESALRLEPYQGYLQLPDALPVARVGLTNRHITARGAPLHPGFVAIDVSHSLWGRLPAREHRTEPPIKGDGPV